MKWSVAFAAAVALASSSAVAADLPVKAPPMVAAPVFNWTGFYVGAHVGHLWGDSENDTSGFIRPNGSAESWFVGVHGGYRYQFPSNWVLGIQVSAPIWGEDQTFDARPFGGGIVTVEYKGSVLAQGMAGYAFGRFLPFVTVGGGVAWIDAYETFGAVRSAVNSNTHTLLTAGVGFKYALTPNWHVGLSYNHIWTSEERYSCAPVCGIPAAGFKLDADAVTGSIDYRF